MPPELFPILTQWGPVALILFAILYRADQLFQKIITDLLPVIIKHFTKLDEGFDTMKAAVENQAQQTLILAKMAERLEEMGEGLSEDHQAIADDAMNAHHHARRAADGVEEILRIIPQRIGHEKEAG